MNRRQLFQNLVSILAAALPVFKNSPKKEILLKPPANIRYPLLCYEAEQMPWDVKIHGVNFDKNNVPKFITEKPTTTD